MAIYTSGKELKDSVDELRNKTKEMLTSSREKLLPLLTVQNKSLSEFESMSSLITDINKLQVVDQCTSPYEDLNLSEFHSDLFANNVLPSDVIILNNNRIIFIDDGLLYITDYDEESTQIVNQRIYKIEAVWNLCKECSYVRLVKGQGKINTEPYLWIVPSYSDYLIVIYGAGLSGSGDINHKIVELPRECKITDFKDGDGTIAMITDKFTYYYIENFDYMMTYYRTDWKCGYSHNELTCICDNNVKYLGSVKGDIYLFDTDTGAFNYVIDNFSEKDYFTHFDDYYINRDKYKPIIALGFHAGRWSLVVNDTIYTTSVYDPEDKDLNSVDHFYPIQLPVSMSQAYIVANDLSDYDRSIVYGMDNNLNAVAFSFRSEDEEVIKIDIDSTTTPQFTFFSVSDHAAVMLNLYEEKVTIDSYYSQEFIDNMELNGDELYDLSHITLGMRIARYEGYEYTFEHEFTPNFIPNSIVSGEDATILIPKCNSDPIHNIALSVDQDHWFFLNIDPEVAINVQAIAYGNSTYVMCGLDSEFILVSTNGYQWRRITLHQKLDLVSITYNPIRKKFYMLPNNGGSVVVYDPESESVSTFQIPKYENTIKIMSLYHNIIITYQDTEDVKSIMTTSREYEAIDANPLKVISLYGMNGYIADAYTINDNAYLVYITNEQYYDSNVFSDIRNSAVIECVTQVSKTNALLDSPVQIVDSTIDHTYLNGYRNDVCNLTFFADSVFLSRSNPIYYLNHKDYRNPYEYINLCGKYRYIDTVCKQMAVHGKHIHKIHSYRNHFRNISYMMTTVEKEPMVKTSDVASSFVSSILYPHDIIETTPPSKNTFTLGDYHTLSVHLSEEESEPGPIILGKDDIYVRLNPSSMYGSISSDGNTWNPLMMPDSPTGVWKDIAYNRNTGYYAIICYFNSVSANIYYTNELYPDHNDNWLVGVVTKDGFPYENGWNEIESVGDYFVAISNIGLDNHSYIYSTIGDTWKMVTLPEAPLHIRKCDKDGKHVIITTAKSAYLISATDIEKPVQFINANEEIQQYTDISIPYIDIINKAEYGYLIRIETPWHAIAKLTNSEESVVGSINPSNHEFESIFSLDESTKLTNVYSFTDSLDYTISVFYDAFNVNKLYILVDNSLPNEYVVNDKSIKNLLEVEIPDGFVCNFNHLICYKNQKLVINGSRIMTIDLHITLPNMIEGCFYVDVEGMANQSLPFTPDHVFLFNANSPNEMSKFLLAEIHRDEFVKLDNAPCNSITLFDNGVAHVEERADVSTQIIENGFIFVNETMKDRYINFIAIKENQYD